MLMLPYFDLTLTCVWVGGFQAAWGAVVAGKTAAAVASAAAESFGSHCTTQLTLSFDCCLDAGRGGGRRDGRGGRQCGGFHVLYSSGIELRVRILLSYDCRLRRAWWWPARQLWQSPARRLILGYVPTLRLFLVDAVQAAQGPVVAGETVVAVARAAAEQ